MLNMLKEAMWHVTVGWFDFYHFYVFDSIVSLQIIFLFFYFFTKIRDFFSLQIETWII